MDNANNQPPSRAAVRDWRHPLRVDGPATTRPSRCHLVVGFDRDPVSYAALSYAIALAGRLDAFLHVIHALDLDDLPIDPDSADWEEHTADVVEEERRQAYHLLAAFPGNWAYHSRQGKPAHLLTAVADANDALMIVIGTPREGVMGWIERLLGESVSLELAHHTHRPVLLVPPAAP